MAIKKDGRDYILETKENQYNLKLTFKALDYLDNVYTLEDEDSKIKFGFGVNKLVVGLQMKNVTAIIHFIKATTLHLAQKPSEEELIEMIDLLSDKDYDGLFDIIIDFLTAAALTKHTMKKIEQAAKKEQKQVAKKN